MNELEFSVIIPLYNKESSILKSIYSVLNQTIDNFEIIIVDDGCTDHSVQIVKSIADNRIKLIHKKNGGVSSARNYGIKNAQGRYICFLDADDIWEKDFLETTKHLFELFPKAGMVCPSYQVSYGTRVIHPKWRSVSNGDCLVSNFYEMATASFWICHSSCVAIPKVVLDNMDYLFAEDETVYEDFDMWLRIGSRYPVGHSDKICATYMRITDENARKTHNGKIVYSKRYMQTIDKLYTDRFLSAQEKQWLNEIRDRRMVPYIFSLLLMSEKKQAKKELIEWKPTKTYKKYHFGLSCAINMPQLVIKAVNAFRYKAF